MWDRDYKMFDIMVGGKTGQCVFQERSVHAGLDDVEEVD